ncbi:hypothetical protein [Hydrogenivirga sp. 128-5-R1-1]|uniref:hypothetical protein n=1 Tax=Hydrogenivirga sp. 128-5-R1-1 TaxID=392423 RepID=UPI00015F33BE|nr:hypothetical protein [Hydrogenivirga sp. 128-5-R1-1]EDP74842.1 hypothetical protein HG1285_13277 [Hydrogenivirga sp. 128-5-R1-1]
MRKVLGFLSAVFGVAVLGICTYGCGGGGGGGGGSGNTVTIKVYNYMGMGSTVFVAAQDGNGTFQKPQVATLSISTHGSPTETYTFIVNDPDRKYGVIAVCAPASGIPEGRAVFLTLDESSEVIISCGTLPENETLSGNLTWKTPSTDGKGVFIKWGRRYGVEEAYVFDGSTSYSVSAHTSPNDLVVLYGAQAGFDIQPESVYVERSVPSGGPEPGLQRHDEVPYKGHDNGHS